MQRRRGSPRGELDNNWIIKFSLSLLGVIKLDILYVGSPHGNDYSPSNDRLQLPADCCRCPISAPQPASPQPSWRSPQLWTPSSSPKEEYNISQPERFATAQFPGVDSSLIGALQTCPHLPTVRINFDRSHRDPHLPHRSRAYKYIDIPQHASSCTTRCLTFQHKVAPNDKFPDVIPLGQWFGPKELRAGRFSTPRLT